MSTPISLPVKHPTGSYNITVGAELLPRVRALANIKGPLALISDSQVGPLHGDRCPPVELRLTIPAGEANKTLATANSLYAQLLAAGIDRQGTIVALGGGVVGDLAGFVAATYLRGIDFVQCPTSLLAMVDASVGGKTGVDLPEGKNLVGAFKQPTAVLADISTLATLPAVEFANGMAEVIKHGLIGDPELFAFVAAEGHRLAAAGPDQWQMLVSQAIAVKRSVVEEDPFEHGRRATLNLGHTFGHALELVSRYRISHGQGVAMGLIAAVQMSINLGYCEAALLDRLTAVLSQVGLPTRLPAEFNSADIYQAMFSDKKKAQNRLRFILIKGIGDVFVAENIDEADVLGVLTAVQAA